MYIIIESGNSSLTNRLLLYVMWYVAAVSVYQASSLTWRVFMFRALAPGSADLTISGLAISGLVVASKTRISEALILFFSIAFLLFLFFIYLSASVCDSKFLLFSQIGGAFLIFL
jgi:hypothetical protein